MTNAPPQERQRRLPPHGALTPVLIALAALAATAALLAGAPELPDGAALAGGLIVFTVGLWATGALPEHLTALLFFLIAMLTGIAPAEIVFSGFASTALWLVFGGLVLAGAVDAAGLGQALAARLTGRTGRSYGQVIAGVAAVGTVLAFLVPSTMGRVLVMLPIVLALADRLGYPPGSRGRAGMVLATILSTYLVACAILPSNVPNLVMVGAVETVLGGTIRYGDYLILHFPVLGALKLPVVVGVVTALFRDTPVASTALSPADAEQHAVPSAGRRLTAVLLVTLALWATDFAHGVSPAWIALGAAAICLWPGSGLLPPDALTKRINLTPFLYVAGVLGMARLIDSSGLGAWLSGVVLDVLPAAGASDALVFASLSTLATLIGVVATMPAVPAALTPLAAEVAPLAGWPAESVVMTQVIGFSTLVLPHQIPPMMVGLALSGVRVADATRATLATAAVTVVLLWPLAYLWWRIVGMFEG